MSAQGAFRVAAILNVESSGTAICLLSPPNRGRQRALCGLRRGGAADRTGGAAALAVSGVAGGGHAVAGRLYPLSLGLPRLFGLM